MAYQSKRRKLTAEINVVPYIDVMLVLLIIFMASAPFITQGVDVDLPQTTNAKTVTNTGGVAFIIVEVNQHGDLGLSVNNGDMVHGLSLNDLLLQVQAELVINPKSSVLVGGDGKVSYSKIMLTLDALSQVGVTSVGLMTNVLDS
ncbi:protein TolR [Candidatus Enterovibrio escicola]|uniref:Tol-Pal system protein TolR n=1 Tax=Candidatus Enterovibrio escicola TaxID=1927127 RepID=A0A2A5T0D3_9GAMM|nr:protein TolR [Candidatus Enterovibrio escacola]PCS21601.1 Tol biopolymer transport system, TolR protein [Candidatus Enterovibrio escacola]